MPQWSVRQPTPKGHGSESRLTPAYRASEAGDDMTNDEMNRAIDVAMQRYDINAEAARSLFDAGSQPTTSSR